MFTESLEAILYAESRFGLRPTETFRDPTEKGVFDSIVARYLGYVNPLHRLPLSVLDDLCEVANPRWSTGLNGSKIHVAESDFKGLSLADQLALGYPSHEQREAYYLWADRKFRTLRTSQPAGCGVVAKAVAVKWEDRLVTGRFGDVLTPLLQDVAVQYQTVVRHIEWRNGVRVHVAKQRRVGEFGNDPDDDVRDRDHHRSNEQEVYEAKHCIVAVPVGVLKGS